jgi:hypothetical protein
VGFIDPRLSVATLVRLLLPDLFAGHYDSLLYLDCDLTIHTDVSQLFRLDIGACPVAAQRRGMLFFTPLLAEEGARDVLVEARPRAERRRRDDWRLGDDDFDQMDD